MSEHDTAIDDRSENMVEFARLGLKLLLEVIEEADAKDSKKP